MSYHICKKLKLVLCILLAFFSRFICHRKMSKNTLWKGAFT